ncbi:MAG: nSTAND1 domain-containing NTPase [Planctomycetaceae bacterium]
MRTIRIFVSSPGDVGEERRLSGRIIERLQFRYAGRVTLEPLFWEHLPLTADASFQEQIPRPSEFDIVILILWSRMGSPLPESVKRADGSRYASGTEFEFEDALEGFRRQGFPDILVYRKSAAVTVELTHDEQALLELTRQKKLADQFIDRWFRGADGSFSSAFHNFAGSDEFEELLEQHLRRSIAARVDAQESLTSLSVERPLWEQGSPFRGLERFEFEHGLIYCGRTKAIQEVLDSVRRRAAEGCPFVLVFGKSGVGKSSFARAGVLPFMCDPGVIEGVRVWRRAIFEPSDSTGDLLDGLSAALLTPTALPELSGVTTEAELAGLLRASPAGAIPLIRQQLLLAAQAHQRDNRLAEPAQARLALLIDPLEEIFTRPGASAPDRERFVAALDALCRSGLVYVLATMRSDFYERCGELPGLLALKAGAGQYHLAPPTPAEIGRMIRLPAQIAGLRFEEDADQVALDEVLKDAAAGDPGALPLLQFALDEIYKKSDAAKTRLLTFAAYQELGGVHGALRTRAEELMRDAAPALGPRFEPTLRAVFSAVVGVNEADHAVARQYAYLDRIAADPDQKLLVETLVAGRLFMTDLDDEGQPAVTLAHEALLRHWPRLTHWIDENKDFLRIRARVAVAAERWAEERREPTFLLAEGKPLAEAEELLRRRRDELPAEVIGYIESSTAAAREHLRRERHRTQRIIATVTTAACLAGVLSIVSFLQYRRAERNRDEAQANFQQAEQNRQEAQQNFEQAEVARADEAVQREAAVSRARAAQKLIQFLLQDLRDSLQPDHERDAALIAKISTQVVAHFRGLEAQHDSGELRVEHAENLARVAEIFRKMARFGDAAELAQEALDLRKSLPGSNDVEVAQILELLGLCHSQLGQRDLAEHNFRDALAVYENAYGPEHLEVGLVCGRLAELFRQQGRFVEAAHVHARALRLLESAPHPDDYALAADYNDLAELYRNMGRFEDAEPLFNKALEIVSREPVRDRRQLAEVQGNLGVFYGDRHDFERAETLLRQALDLDRRAVGSDNPHVAADLYKLARVLTARGNLDEADSCLVESERILTGNHMERHVRMGKCQEAFAELCLARKQYTDAERRARRVLEIRERTLPAPHPEIVRTLDQLSRIASGAGRALDAETLADQARRMHQEHETREATARQQLSRQAAAGIPAGRG